MKLLAHYVSIKLIGLLFVFLTLGLTFNTNVKNDPEYTEVLHFKYGYKPYSNIESDNLFDDMGLHPKWLFNELPNDLNPDLASELFDLGYKRSEVRKRDFAKLDSIFICELVDKIVISECLAVYRDILIFRKKKKVIKIVQLCFDCEQSHFIGPWTNVKSFGQRGEFSKLKVLLEK